ncbi:MAG: TolC family protein [Gammaproteobacteria bacterium]
MKRIAVAWLAALATLAVHGAAIAQNAPPAAAPGARIITFQEAIRTALEQNTSVRASQNAAALGQVNVSEAKGQFLPNLTASTTGSENYGRSFDANSAQLVNKSTQSVSVGLNTGVVVFDGFGNIAQLKGAKLSSAASEQELHRARETVAFNVASQFLALIQRQEQLRVQRENLQAVSQLEEQIQTFVDNGARTIADLYQQQANAASARFAVVDAERTAELAKVDLMQTLQLDPRATYEFEPRRDSTAEAASQQFDLGALQTRATGQRIDLKAEQARVDAADQNVRVARSNRWPTLSLNAGYSSTYNSATGGSFADQLDDRRGGSMSLGVSVPIFDRFATNSATRRAEIQADNERLNLENLQQDVALQVRRAHLDFQAAQEQLVVAQAQVRAAGQSLQATQERYTAGASTLVEVTQARAAQVQAASALVFARFNLQFQRTLIDYYTGDLDPVTLGSQ